MSRIQDILSKAERDGSVRHTPRCGDDPRPATAEAPAAEARRRRAARWSAAPRATRAPLPEALREVVSVRLSTRCSWPASRRKSLAAEQYRTLRTRLVLLEEGRARRVLLVTSPQKATASR